MNSYWRDFDDRKLCLLTWCGSIGYKRVCIVTRWRAKDVWLDRGVAEFSKFGGSFSTQRQLHCTRLRAKSMTNGGWIESFSYLRWDCCWPYRGSRGTILSTRGGKWRVIKQLSLLQTISLRIAAQWFVARHGATRKGLLASFCQNSLTHIGSFWHAERRQESVCAVVRV